MKHILKIVSIIILSNTVALAQNEEIPNNENVNIANESAINGQKLDFSPAFYEDGIVFITNQTDKKSKVYDKNINSQAMMIMLARRGTDGKLQTPVPFAEDLITPYHEGPITFDKVGEEAYFSRNNYEKGNLVLAKEAENGKQKALQQIYVATKTGTSWKDVKKLPFNMNEYSFRHPSLSIDGKKLYFSSNRPGGKGGYDIWVSSLVSGEWGEPTNVDSINTASNEAFPFIHASGFLFFASDKKGGVGGFDIYYSQPVENKVYSSAKNLGTPFNSKSDDFGFILDLDRKNGYFTSARTGGKGMDDIYTFNSENKIPIGVEDYKPRKMMVCVLDKSDNSSIADATIKYVNIDNYSIREIATDTRGNITKFNTEDNINILQLVTDQPLQTLKSGADCKAPFNVADGQYLVNVFKEGYAPKQAILKIKKEKDLYQVFMEKLDGKVELVSNVNDDKGRPIPGAKVTIIDDETGEEQTVQTDPEGKISYAVKPQKCYTIKVNKPNYASQTTKTCAEELLPGKRTEVQVKVQMDEIASPFVEGAIIELTNVYYNFNDATLRPDALKDINALLKVMRDYPELEIELSSHTDSRASHAYNIGLSQRRAESVVNYLKQNGIASHRVIARGYGETSLKNHCADGINCSEEEHQRNRRTEVKILKGANNTKISVVDKLPEYIDAKPGTTSSHSAVYAGSDNNSISNVVAGTSTSTSYGDVTSGSFWVVSGSFSNANNATQQQLNLMNLGFPETTIEFAPEKNTHRVIVGKMTSMSAASARVRELNSKGIKGAFVLQR